jgi:hypothetical protein
MEEKYTICRARVEFKSYMKIVLIIGFCTGVLTAVFNLVYNLYQNIFGENSVPILESLGLLPLSLLALVICPLSLGAYGLVAYPIYRYITNKWFTVSLCVYGEREH